MFTKKNVYSLKWIFKTVKLKREQYVWGHTDTWNMSFRKCSWVPVRTRRRGAAHSALNRSPKLPAALTQQHGLELSADPPRAHNLLGLRGPNYCHNYSKENNRIERKSSLALLSKGKYFTTLNHLDPPYVHQRRGTRNHSTALSCDLFTGRVTHFPKSTDQHPGVTRYGHSMGIHLIFSTAGYVCFS